MDTALDQLRRLTAADVRQRMDEIEDELRALRVLYRSLAARERVAARRAAKPAAPEGVCHG